MVQVETDIGKVGKIFDTRRGALNYIDVFHPEESPAMFKVQLDSGEIKYLLEIIKPVAIISDVEYSVVKIEDPQEGIENAE